MYSLNSRLKEKIPVEVHVFERQNNHYVFDVRNNTVMSLSALMANVVLRVSRQTFEEIIADLPEFLPIDIKLSYEKILTLMDGGILSSGPVISPPRPLFSRLVLMLAGGCNMACAYCFEKDKPSYRELNLMTRETADDCLNWFFKHQEGDNAHIQVYGGEPLLNWPVLTHVVERAEEWAQSCQIELSIYMITNGTLLDSEKITFLKAHNIGVQVSVDGDQKTHDRFRVFKSGQPTMQAIKPNIDELRQQGVNFNLRAVLTSENMDPVNVTNGLRALGCEKVSFEVVASDSTDIRLHMKDWEVFQQKYKEYLEMPYHSWKELPQEMQNIIIRLCENKRLFYGCGANVQEVTISPDGSIFSCQRVYKEPISHVAKDMHPREFDPDLVRMVDDRPICRDCWARYLCGGGCMHMSHIEGTGKDPVPEYCRMKRHLCEAAIVKIREIKRFHHAIDNDAD